MKILYKILIGTLVAFPIIVLLGGYIQRFKSAPLNLFFSIILVLDLLIFAGTIAADIFTFDKKKEIMEKEI